MSLKACIRGECLSRTSSPPSQTIDPVSQLPLQMNLTLHFLGGSHLTRKVLVLTKLSQDFTTELLYAL